MARIVAALAALALLLSLSACRARLDLTVDPFAEETPTTTTTRPGNNLPEVSDEMAEHAWEIYENALEQEAAYTSYDLTYEGRQTMLGETVLTKAHMVQVTHPDGKREILVEVQHSGGEESGYFKDGVGYFHKDGKKYWILTDEETFLSELGFSEGATLSEEMFGDAIAVNNPDGTVTVSCPLDGKYAAQYVRLQLGDSVAGGEVVRAEETVTVDAAGAPLTFTSAAAVNLPMYGQVSAESVNRYVATGADVVLTPPTDLDEYVSIIEE